MTTRNSVELIPDLQNKRILITGACGLIGSAIVDYLMKLNAGTEGKIEVFALARKQHALEKRFEKNVSNAQLHLLVGDVTNFDCVGLNVDYIIHAASPAHPLAYSQTPVDVMQANLLGTINMLELAKQCNARMVFISSGEVYGISRDPNSAFQEREYGYIDILNPRACYPESKRAAETLCASYAAQYGVQAKIARLCHVYGPTITEENSRADAQFLRNALGGNDIVMKSAGTQVRSFCYVEDAVTGILYILIRGASGEAYNVANRNSTTSIREYAEILADLANVTIINDFPSDVEAQGYSYVSRSVLDASKLEKIGWTPKHTLAGGLQETLNYYKSKQ